MTGLGVFTGRLVADLLLAFPVGVVKSVSRVVRGRRGVDSVGHVTACGAGRRRGSRVARRRWLGGVRSVIVATGGQRSVSGARYAGRAPATRHPPAGPSRADSWPVRT